MTSKCETITNELLFKTFPDEILSKIFLYRPVHKFAQEIKEGMKKYNLDTCIGSYTEDVTDVYTSECIVSNNKIYICSFYKYMLSPISICDE